MTEGPPSLEAAYWLEKVNEAKRGGQIDVVQKAATAWTALLSSLLGVFGLVAFAGGLQEIDDLGSPYSTWAKVATTVAAIALAVATCLAASAAHNLFPETTSDTSWQGYRNTVVAAARRSKKRLEWARRAGLVAVAVVVIGSALALWAPAAESPTTSVLVRSGETTRCGKLASKDGRLRVADADLVGSDEIVVVTKCP